MIKIKVKRDDVFKSTASVVDKQQEKKLSRKQQLFVEAYCGQCEGNATESARVAGYKGNDNCLSALAVENLRKPSIIAAIEDFDKKNPKVASAEKIRKFWSETMAAREQDMSDRLKASELLAKASAMFVKRHEHRVNLGMTDDTITAIKASVLGIPAPTALAMLEAAKEAK